MVDGDGNPIRGTWDSLGSQVQHLQASMDSLTTQVGLMRDTLIRIEEQDYKAQMSEMRAKIGALESGLVTRVGLLESDRDRRAGANNLVEWLSRNGLTLVVVLGAMVVYWGKH
jgi:hypothetical protein